MVHTRVVGGVAGAATEATPLQAASAPACMRRGGWVVAVVVVVVVAVAVMVLVGGSVGGLRAGV